MIFLLLSAHAQVFEEKVANVSLAFQSTMYGVLHVLGLTFLLFSAHGQVFEGKVANVSLTFKLTMDSCFSNALADLFTTLRAEKGGQCDPGLSAVDGWSVALPRLLPTFLLLSAHAQVFEEKVANVSLAFELMMDGGLPQPKARPEDIVNLDLKSTLRLKINTRDKYSYTIYCAVYRTYYVFPYR